MDTACKVLVTGADGFIGRRLNNYLSDHGYQITACSRSSNKAIPPAVAVGDIGPDTDWAPHLRDIDVVIHLAATVHAVNGGVADEQYRLVNTAGTLNLARQAVAAGVRRFILLSSIKVNGESTLDRPFSDADVPSPTDPYANSKWAAEQGLQELSNESGLEVVIIRPPLVYGPEVKANFLSLLKVVDRQLPLPLGSVRNQRSLIALDNLVSLITTCIEHPSASSEVFLASDGQDVSTPELITMIAASMGKPDRVFPFPLAILNVLAWFAGKQPQLDRLTGSLQVDSSRARKLLGWEPPFTMQEAIQNTVNWYQEKYH